MQITELSRPEQREHAKKLLSDAGYNELGFGSFGNVFHKEGKPYVLKLFEAEDIAYLDFLKLVMKNLNKHFPKIFGKIIKVTADYYAVRLEKLDRYEGDSDVLWKLYFYIRDRDDVLAALNGTKEFNEYRKMELLDIAEWMEIEYHKSELLIACDLIADLVKAKNYRVDVRNIGNIMVRGKTLVFSDPVAPRLH